MTSNLPVPFYRETEVQGGQGSPRQVGWRWNPGTQTCSLDYLVLVIIIAPLNRWGN